MAEALDRTYDELPNDMLLEVSTYPTDIFLRIGHVKYLKMGLQGEPVETERIKKYISRSKYDFPFYVSKGTLQSFSQGTYVPIRIGTVLIDQELPADSFLKNEDGYVQFKAEGEVFAKDIYDDFKEKEVKRIYIKADDEPKYQAFLDRKIDEILENAEGSVMDKAFTLREAGTRAVQDAYENFDDGGFDKIKKLAETIVKFIDDSNIEGIKGLLAQEQEGNVFQHALNVSSMALTFVDYIFSMKDDEGNKDVKVIVQTLDDNKQTRDIISIGGLLHDLGKVHPEHSDEENIENHPRIGSEALESYNDNPVYLKIAEVISQHEEFCDGTGYPNKLKKASISPYAQVISMINFFDKLQMDPNNKDTDLKDLMKENESKFNKYMLNIFYKFLDEVHS